MGSPSVSTIKRLFAVSGNQCAFPKCPITIIEESSNKVIGKICHIKAQSPKGPRYDENQSEEERHSFENLILLCPIHHDVIDSDIESYTVKRLNEIKLNHENIFQNTSKKVSDEFIKIMIENVIISQFNEDSSVISKDQKGGQTAHHISNFVLNPDTSLQYEKDLQTRRDEHDLKIFRDSEMILNEDQFNNGLSNLIGGHFFRDDFFNLLIEFRIYFGKMKNQYLNQNLGNLTNILESNLQELEHFLAENFFDYPPNQQTDNMRFCLYPDLCIDRSGSGEPKDMNLYDSHVEKLNEVVKKTWESYVNYRKEIKVTLLV